MIKLLFLKTKEKDFQLKRRKFQVDRGCSPPANVCSHGLRQVVVPPLRLGSKERQNSNHILAVQLCVLSCGMKITKPLIPHSAEPPANFTFRTSAALACPVPWHVLLQVGCCSPCLPHVSPACLQKLPE